MDPLLIHYMLSAPFSQYGISLLVKEVNNYSNEFVSVNITKNYNL